MTAFDYDPEYEAQLRDVLGDDHQVATWRDSSHHNVDHDDEMGDFVKDTDDGSEDGVLNDAPNFRLRVPLPSSSSNQRLRTKEDEDEGSVSGKVLSEYARSISTGDDSPSVPVLPPLTRGS